MRLWFVEYEEHAGTVSGKDLEYWLQLSKRIILRPGDRAKFMFLEVAGTRGRVFVRRAGIFGYLKAELMQRLHSPLGASTDIDGILDYTGRLVVRWPIGAEPGHGVCVRTPRQEVNRTLQ